MIEVLDTYDWQASFEYAQPTACPPLSEIDLSPFTREDVETIVWIEEGDNDGPNWVIGGTLKDGRWFFLSAGCDYTGWGCQEWGDAYVGLTRESIERFGMGEGERDRLGVTLID